MDEYVEELLEIRNQERGEADGPDDAVEL